MEIENKINNNENDENNNSCDKIEKEFFEKFEEFHKQLNVLLETAGSLAPIWEQQYLKAQKAFNDRQHFCDKNPIDALPEACRLFEYKVNKAVQDRYQLCIAHNLCLVYLNELGKFAMEYDKRHKSIFL